MKESSLHAALKERLSQPDDQLESLVDGYIIDIVHNDHLIEIQTGNFSSLKTKLPALLENHPTCLVYPIPMEKWIVRLPDQDKSLELRRKSPKRGRLEHLFVEMVRIPHLPIHPNFSLVVLMTQEEEIWKNDGKGSWRRRGWSIKDRRLLDILECYVFNSLKDYLSLVPEDLPSTFTIHQLSARLKVPYNLASKMVYCLRKMGLIDKFAKQGRSTLYTLSTDQ